MSRLHVTRRPPKVSTSDVVTPLMPGPYESCDACPGRAIVGVRLRSGGGLVLCASHARRYDAALVAEGAMLAGDYSFERFAKEKADEAQRRHDRALALARQSGHPSSMPRRADPPEPPRPRAPREDTLERPARERETIDPETRTELPRPPGRWQRFFEGLFRPVFPPPET